MSAAGGGTSLFDVPDIRWGVSRPGGRKGGSWNSKHPVVRNRIRPRCFLTRRHTSLTFLINRRLMVLAIP